MTHVPNNPAAARFAFDNTYARALEGFYVAWKAAQVARPRLIKLNRELAEELGLDAGALDSERNTAADEPPGDQSCQHDEKAPEGSGAQHNGYNAIEGGLSQLAHSTPRSRWIARCPPR